MCEINATPAQVMAEHLVDERIDKSSNQNSHLTLIDKSMASRLVYGYYP